MSRTKILTAFLATALLSGLALAHASAHEASESPAMREGAEVQGPFGYYGWCRRAPERCLPVEAAPPVAFNEARKNDLIEAFVHARESLTYVTDWDQYGKEEFWVESPGTGAGDCEDFALTARRHLLDAGWPASNLRLAVAVTHKGQPWGRLHIVLIAITDREEYVIDNRAPAIFSWRALPYEWRVRQDATLARWVLIDEPKPSSDGGLASDDHRDRGTSSGAGGIEIDRSFGVIGEGSVAGGSGRGRSLRTSSVEIDSGLSRVEIDSGSRRGLVDSGFGRDDADPLFAEVDRYSPRTQRCGR